MLKAAPNTSSEWCSDVSFKCVKKIFMLRLVSTHTLLSKTALRNIYRSMIFWRGSRPFKRSCTFLFRSNWAAPNYLSQFRTLQKNHYKSNL